MGLPSQFFQDRVRRWDDLAEEQDGLRQQEALDHGARTGHGVLMDIEAGAGDPVQLELLEGALDGLEVGAGGFGIVPEQAGAGEQDPLRDHVDARLGAVVLEPAFPKGADQPVQKLPAHGDRGRHASRRRRGGGSGPSGRFALKTGAWPRGIRRNRCGWTATSLRERAFARDRDGGLIGEGRLRRHRLGASRGRDRGRLEDSREFGRSRLGIGPEVCDGNPQQGQGIGVALRADDSPPDGPALGIRYEQPKILEHVEQPGIIGGNAGMAGGEEVRPEGIRDPLAEQPEVVADPEARAATVVHGQFAGIDQMAQRGPQFFVERHGGLGSRPRRRPGPEGAGHRFAVGLGENLGEDSGQTGIAGGIGQPGAEHGRIGREPREPLGGDEPGREQQGGLLMPAIVPLAPKGDRVPAGPGIVAEGAGPGIPGPGKAIVAMDGDGLVDGGFRGIVQQGEGEHRVGPQVLLEDGFLRGSAGRQEIALADSEGGDGDLEPMIEQPAGIGVVMGFGRRQLLGPGRESGQDHQVVPLEMSAGRAGQLLEAVDGLPAASQEVPRGQDREDSRRRNGRTGREGFRWDLRTLAMSQEPECGLDGASNNHNEKIRNLTVARIARRRIKAASKPPKSIEELAERYCREIVLRPVSQEAYLTIGRLFQRDTGIVVPSRVTRDVVIEWRDAVLDRASIATWNSYLGWMRNLFNLAVRRGWLAESPFREVRAIRAPTKRKTVSKNLLGEALDRLQSDPAPIRPGWFWAAAFKLLFYTGMRRRQLTTLRWWHIDFENGTILLVVEGSKTKLEWTIPIPLACLDDLLALRRRSEKSCTTNLAMAQVFRIQLFDENYAGNELTPAQVTGAFARLSEQLSGRVSPHRLRHTMATELAQGRNPDLRSLQYILGHRSIGTTMGYVQPEIAQVRLQLSKLRI